MKWKTLNDCREKPDEDSLERSSEAELGNLNEKPCGIMDDAVSIAGKVKLNLSSEGVFRLDGDMRGLQIVCRSGVLRISQADDERDHILRAGDRLVVSNFGLVQG